MEERMDIYFSSVGLRRKRTPQDGSCLFRAVAEQVLLCQSLHTQVRARCVEYLRDHRDSYEAFIEGDFEDYLCKIQDPQHWVGEVEINALAVIYKRDFLIFREPGKPAVSITENGFKDHIQLCFLNGNHYDSVYPVSYIQNAAFCQSLLYQLLYERVFKEERSVLGHAQRGGRSSELTDDHMTACPSSDDSDTEDPLWMTDVPKQGVHQNRGRGRGRGRGLSERLKRSLNPDLLRNVDYDVWLTSKRAQQKMDFCMAAGMQYSAGDHCQVQVSLEAGGRSYSGSIRKVSPSNGPVTVYVEELGKEVCVPLLSLRPVTESSWRSVVSGGKRANGHTGEWVEPKGRGRGKLLPASAPPTSSQPTGRGSPGHVQKPTSWLPQTTRDDPRGSRGRSVPSEEAGSRGSSEESREQEELQAALLEVHLRDEENFPALGAVAQGNAWKRRGGEGMTQLNKSGATTAQVDSTLPDDVTSTSPSSSPPSHPGPPPTTWLASIKAPLANQSTSRPPGTTAERRTPSPLLTTTSPSSAPIFVAPVAPPPGGAHFYLPHTGSAPSSSSSAPPQSSLSSSSSSPSSTRPDGPAPDVMHTARPMQLPPAYVPTNIVPSNPVPQTSLPQDPTPHTSGLQNPLLQSPVPCNPVPQNLLPSVPQNLQPSVPQHLQPSVPQHLQPSVPQHLQPSVPQHLQPSVPQHLQPSVPQHLQPSVPQHPSTQPSVPQHPSTQPSVPQHPSTQPSVPQHPSTQPSVPQHPSTRPSVPQHPLTQPSVPQHPSTQPSVPQHPSTQPSVPQQPSTQPSVPQQPSTQPSVPQQPSTQPSVPQQPSTQPSVPQQPSTQPSVPQHPSTQPSVPQHPSTQPSVPPNQQPSVPQNLQPSVPQNLQPSVPQHLQPSVPQHLQPSVPQHLQPSVPQHLQPSVPQHLQHLVPEPSVAQYPLPQHLVPEPSVAQYSLPQHPLPQHLLPEPSVPQHLVPQHPLPRHLALQYPQASNLVPGLSSAGSQASAGSPHSPFSHLQAPPLPPNPLPPQDTFSPSPRPEPSQGAVPLQQLSQLYQDPLYPDFPVGSTGHMLPPPPYSSSNTGDDLPRDLNVLRWFFNLGVKAYSNPVFPPYMYLWPLQQAHRMHHAPPSPGPHPDPAPLQQGVHLSPPLPWQQTPPPGYPSSSPGVLEVRYPGPLSPGLQLHASTPGGLDGYRATGAAGANGASDPLLGASAEGVLADQGHQSLTRPVLLVDPPLNNTPIWVSEPQLQDSMVGVTTTAAPPHGSGPAPALYAPDKGHQRPAYPGAGMLPEPWGGPEAGPFTPRPRRSYHHHRGGGGGAQRWPRGNRRGYGARGAGPNYSQYFSAPRMTDQGFN